MASEYAFEMRNVTKIFPGVKALDDVSFRVKPGEVHALVGENGAGKSTLMKVLCGLYRPETGKIIINGVEVEIKNARDAMDKAISMIHQELDYFPDMTVEANLFIRRENVRFGGVVNKAENMKRVRSILAEYEIDIDPNARMKQLTIAMQQMIEIVRAVAFNAQIVIMDEPTSSLTEAEVTTLFKMIRKLAAEGKAVIYISHKLDEIFEIADTVTVIRDGQTIGTKPISELDRMQIITMMVGRELKNYYDKANTPTPQERLKVEGLSRGKEFQDISFTVHAGEIFGFLGLVGAGRSEVAETIFGIRKPERGTITVNGKVVHNRHPRFALRNKMAFITEDRKLYGLSLMHNIRQNAVLSNLCQYSANALGVVSGREERKGTDRMIKALNIKAPSQETRVESLSGGNQQKVVISKWLLTEPDIMIMDEPTRGIDVGAKSEIYKIMSDMASQGKAIIMISSEMPELLGMCDRIMVMCEGKERGVFSREEFDQVKMMTCATGTKKEDLAL